MHSYKYIFILSLLWLMACNAGRPHDKKLLPLHYDKNPTVKVWELGSKYILYTSEMTIDADGSPRAYNPGNTGIDDTAYAHKQTRLSPDIIVYERGKPYIQKPPDPYPGYYISQTELQYLTMARSNYKRFVNSEEVPYISVPANLKKYVMMGDITLLYNKHTKKYAYAIVADSGDDTHIGEGSVRLAQNLGISLSFSHHVTCTGCGSGITYLIVKRSTRLIPLSEEEIYKIGSQEISVGLFKQLIL